MKVKHTVEHQLSEFQLNEMSIIQTNFSYNFKKEKE